MATALPHPERAENGEAAYLARLGERVRNWRLEHGTARKALALASGVSERYLAQLEAGEGNISVLLLRRVAHAMNVPVEELVREEDAAPRLARVALIGLRGAGKSTLGEKLAQSLDVPFVELDREVEREAGTPLGEVFSMYGQEAFRRFERRALERVLRSNPRAVIAAGGSLVCDYDSSLPNNTTRLNTATATQQNYDYASDLTATANGTTQYSGTASIDFTGVNPTVTDNTATITDDRGPLNRNESTSGSTSYDETFRCGNDEGSHTNTAVVTEDDSLDSDDDDATTVVNCYQLTVTKDADESFDRDYDWTVAKTRVFATGEVDGDLDPTTLTLDPDQIYTLTYEITVDLDDPAFTDSNWAVEGTITVNNPAPIVADDVVVTDSISGFGGAIALDCDAGTIGAQTTVDIAAGGSVECTYSADLPDATTRTNTATATLFGIGYDGTASIDFGEADISLIDECVVVTDDNGTPGDTSDDTVLDASLCADEAPETYTNTIDVGPFEICGEYRFTNTAHIVAVNDANDTGESHSASYTVIITVPCPEGCTLTPGYWKTHNVLFWGGAPADPTWYLIDPDGDGLFEGPDEDFFDTGDTWFEVFWTNPAGRPYYQLSFQYMAAVLNKASIEDQGGTIPSGVQDAIDDAAALLDQYDVQPDIKGKDAKSIRAQFVTLAGILGSFNEGTYPGGPLHCDEDGSSSLPLSSAGSVTQSSAGFVLLPFGLLPFGIAVLRRRRTKL